MYSFCIRSGTSFCEYHIQLETTTIVKENACETDWRRRIFSTHKAAPLAKNAAEVCENANNVTCEMLGAYHDKRIAC